MRRRKDEHEKEMRERKSRRWERAKALLYLTSGCSLCHIWGRDVVVEPWEKLQPLPSRLGWGGCWRSCCYSRLAPWCLQDTAQHTRGTATSNCDSYQLLFPLIGERAQTAQCWKRDRTSWSSHHNLQNGWCSGLLSGSEGQNLLCNAWYCYFLVGTQIID